MTEKRIPWTCGISIKSGLSRFPGRTGHRGETWEWILRLRTMQSLMNPGAIEPDQAAAANTSGPSRLQWTAIVVGAAAPSILQWEIYESFVFVAGPKNVFSTDEK